MIVLKPLSDIVASSAREMVLKVRTLIDTADGYSEIRLDISNVNIIDSIGISFIVGLYKTAKNNDSCFKVVGVNSDIKHLFKIMKLDELFEALTV